MLTHLCRRLSRLALCCVIASAALAADDDWPQHRFSPSRAAAATHDIPDEMHLQWALHLPQRNPVFAHDDRTGFDDGYQCVIGDGRLFVSFDQSNKVAAYDLATGQLQWRFFADAPVRFAPVYDGDAKRVYFAADDGKLYALKADDGKQLWAFEGAPNRRRILNHERLTSNWPTSGGPAMYDGKLYFAVGYWPMDGVTVHCVESATGKSVWTTDRFGITSCGYIVAHGGQILVPTGGKGPTRYDAKTGKYLGSAGGAFNNYTSEISADDRYFYSGYYAHAVDSGRQRIRSYTNSEHKVRDHAPVLTGDHVYGFNDGIFKQFRYPSAEDMKPKPDKKKKPSPHRLIAVGEQYWAFDRPDYQWSRGGEQMKTPDVDMPVGFYARKLFAKVGDKFLAGGDGGAYAFTDPAEGTPRVTWAAKVDGKVHDMLAGNGHVVVTTTNGHLYCYGAKQVDGGVAPDFAQAPDHDFDVDSFVHKVMKAAGQTDGYIVLYGADEATLRQIKVASPLKDARFIAVQNDADALRKLQLAADDKRMLGMNLSAHLGDATSFELPPHFANLIVLDDLPTEQLADAIARNFRALRPYGGTLVLPFARNAKATRAHVIFEQAGLHKEGELKAHDGFMTITRKGALPGAGDWTHELADAANTLNSFDSHVKAPLGLLWFGGPAQESGKRTYIEFLPPALHAVEGKYIMHGPGLFSCIDVYTGRLIWEREIPKAQFYGSYFTALGFDAPPENAGIDKPGDHEGIKGGDIHSYRIAKNAFTHVTTADKIYLTVAEQLYIYDTNTGELKDKLDLPFKDADAKLPLCWGGIRIVDDLMICTAFDPQDIKDAWDAWRTGNEKNKDRMPMKWLFVADRHSGELKWKQKADSAWLNRGMVVSNGRLIAIDAVTPTVDAALRKKSRTLMTSSPRVRAFAMETGKALWDKSFDFYSPHLAYSLKHDTVIMPCRYPDRWGKDGWRQVDQPQPKNKKDPAPPVGRMIAYNAADGSEAWDVAAADYGEPLIIHDQTDTIIDRNGHTYSLTSGKPDLRANPVTGVPEPWRCPKGGCNFVIASDNFVTWRIAYWDMQYSSGVTGIGGMRSGCTPSIVPANGVMSLFNYSGGYPSDALRSAIVFAHRPDGVNWRSVRADGQPETIRDLGINLGAGADHVDSDGVVWLKHTQVDPKAKKRRRSKGVEWPITIEPADAVRRFDEHPGRVNVSNEPALTAVLASGIVGDTKTPVSIRVPLKGSDTKSFTVRLYFREIDELAPGRRVFNATVGEATETIDVAKLADTPGAAVTVTYQGVKLGDELVITLTPGPDVTAPPLLCGIRLTAEK